MNMSRFGLSAGVAFLLAAPALAQSAEPPAGSTPPAGTATQTTPPAPPPTPPAGDSTEAEQGKEKPESKDGAQAPKPQ
jgi:hypothetical protein